MSRPDRDELEEMYWGRGMSLRQIAESEEVSKQTVSNWLDKHDIDKRSNAYDRPSDETLREWHHEDMMTVEEMAEEVGCSYDTMRRWLHDGEIEIIRASVKRSVKDCADCGTEGGPTSGPEGKTPVRVDAEPYGFEEGEKLCKTCYIKHYRRRKTAEEKAE